MKHCCNIEILVDSVTLLDPVGMFRHVLAYQLSTPTMFSTHYLWCRHVVTSGYAVTSEIVFNQIDQFFLSCVIRAKATQYRSSSRQLSDIIITQLQRCMCNYHSKEGDGPGGMVVDCNEVHNKGNGGHCCGEESSTAQHLLDPFSSCSSVTQCKGTYCNTVHG